MALENTKQLKEMYSKDQGLTNYLKGEEQSIRRQGDQTLICGLGLRALSLLLVCMCRFTFSALL